MAKKSVTIADLTMDSILNGAEVDEAAELAKAPGAPAAAAAPEVTPPADTAPAAPVTPAAEAAPAAPTPPVTPEAAESEEDDDEPVMTLADDDGKWIDELPESERARVRKLHQTAIGRKHALDRKNEQIKVARAERAKAIEIALRSSGRIATETPAAPAAAPKPAAPDVLEVEIGDDGKVRLPVSAITDAVQRAQQPHIDAQRAQQADIVRRGQYADQVLAEAGIGSETQNRLLGAFREMASMFVGVVRQTGARPESSAAERQLLRENGVEAELQKKYPGVTLEDLYDVYDACQDPYNRSHSLVRVAKHYQEAWSPRPAAAAPKAPPATPKIPSHPAPLSRVGGGGDMGVNSTAFERIASMSIDDVLKMTPKDSDQLMDQWEKEYKAGRASA